MLVGLTTGQVTVSLLGFFITLVGLFVSVLFKLLEMERERTQIMTKICSDVEVLASSDSRIEQYLKSEMIEIKEHLKSEIIELKERVSALERRNWKTTNPSK